MSGDGNDAMKKPTNSSTDQQITHEEITALAQQIYEDEGCPCGKAEEHWQEAERRLREQGTGGEPQRESTSVATRREKPVSA